RISNEAKGNFSVQLKVTTSSFDVESMATTSPDRRPSSHPRNTTQGISRRCNGNSCKSKIASAGAKNSESRFGFF
ncbi:hypothetical protein VIGAN_09001500, partial [Vigna angularis var. angularis]